MHSRPTGGPMYSSSDELPDLRRSTCQMKRAALCKVQAAINNPHHALTHADQLCFYFMALSVHTSLAGEEVQKSIALGALPR